MLKYWLLDLAMALVRLKATCRAMKTDVSRSTMCSLSAASEVTSLLVEQGVKPVVSPSFWLTMVSTRPVAGSTTTTLPLCGPSAATAARRMVRSSPSTLSPSVGSTGGGRFARLFLAGMRVVFLACVAVRLAFWSNPPQKQRDKEKLFHVRRRVTSASISDNPSKPLWGIAEGGVNRPAYTRIE